MKIFKILILITVISCSTTEKKGGEIEQEVHKATSTEIEKEISEYALDQCSGCILGSSTQDDIIKNKKTLFKLEGAESLGLENLYFDFPVEINKHVTRWIRNFTKGKGRRQFARYAARAGRYAPIFSKILNDYGLPRDLIFLSMAESGFQNTAKSWAKAVGPWQFMKFTGKRYGLKVNWYRDERRDPIKASIAAAKYLKDLHGMFGDWRLAAAGYNAGEGKIKRAIRRYKTKNFWKIRKGRYLRPETKNYIPKIMALTIIGKNLNTFGFTDIDFEKRLDFEEIEVGKNQDLYDLASTLEMDFKELKRYNPELMRWQTPFDSDTYFLRVPPEKLVTWKKNHTGQNYTATKFKPYKMKSTTSLKAVAKKFRLPSNVLATINGVSSSKRMKREEIVKLPFRLDHSNRHKLYSDLYERSPRRVRRKRTYRKWVRRGRAKGRDISSGGKAYKVRKGDTLWDIAKKTGTPINDLIKTNYKKVKSRSIKPGDTLVVK